MLRNRFGIICFVIALAVFFAAGCGKKGDLTAGSKAAQMTESETAASIMEKSMTESGTEGTAALQEEEPGTLMDDQGESADETYKGPGKQAEAFAEKIQEAVSDRNLEALAELITYPCVFINSDQETIILKKQEDLLKQNPDMVFGDDLMVSVAKVDTATLKKTEEGIVLGEGASRIIFQESPEGSIGITEIKE
ncbi:hypothetical protein [Lacrimispora sp. 38-1]|uniref:hypothetical protein n=1 Tax=Lacrimispora sp. 38-1 TaxID=3125778 RepID=UPI003CEB19DB